MAFNTISLSKFVTYVRGKELDSLLCLHFFCAIDKQEGCLCSLIKKKKNTVAAETFHSDIFLSLDDKLMWVQGVFTGSSLLQSVALFYNMPYSLDAASAHETPASTTEKYCTM